ncbi:MAG: TRAP transporter small permease [Pseudodonghicola sp.]
MKLVETTAGWLARTVAALAAILMISMMVLISMDVLMKYLLNTPIPMTLELVAAYFMPAIVFLPLGVITQGEHHLEVELFTQRLKPRALAWVKLFGILVGIIFFAFLLNESLDQAIRMTRRGEYWETATALLPTWIARWFLPLSCVLTLLWLVLHGMNMAVFGLTGKSILTLHNGPRLGDATPSAET